MINLKQATLTALSLLMTLSVGCGPESPFRMSAPIDPPPPQPVPEIKQPQRVSQDSDGIESEFNPKVDILFVIDNSASMEDEQRDLQRNINRFVDAIASNPLIDFHIGVISVWDSYTFANMQKDYAKGQLRTLKGPDGQALPPEFPPFVSRATDYDGYIQSLTSGGSSTGEPGYLQVLRSSLFIGIEDYNPRWRTELTGGPELEEMFSPARSALKERLLDSNAGFYRPDAHLAVIFLTDADDSSPDDTPSGFWHHLRSELKGGDRHKVSTYGVLVRKNDPRELKDPGLREKPNETPMGPVRLEQFLSMSGGTVLPLYARDYGDRLARIGREIRVKTLRKVIPLGAYPEDGTVEVRYGTQIIPPNSADRPGWKYDPTSRSLVISGEAEINPEPGATITVSFIPVDMNNVPEGTVEPIGGPDTIETQAVQ